MFGVQPGAYGLRPGARVAVVAPAGPVDPAAYHEGLVLLEARYRVVQGIDPAAPRDPALPYLLGRDEQRAALLNRALRDPEVEAIFCARGGYGTMRILPLLDRAALAERRTPLVGFSDCTALHAWAATLGVPSVHGPVVTQLGRLPAADVEALFDLVEGRGTPLLDGLSCLVGGRAAGPLLGGNLSLLCHLIGTPYLPEVDGCILLLEEVGEAPYRVDRLLTQLRLGGLLERVAGVVVGALEGCDAPQGEPALPVAGSTVVRERLGGLGIPVVTGAPVGHGGRNVALPLGWVAQLDAEAGTLRFG